MSKSPTARQLLKQFEGDIANTLSVRRLLGGDYATFVDILECTIDFILDSMAENPKEYQGQKEDQITAGIIVALKSNGYRASHDEKIGGHCDIIVRGKENFLWLAEAKKDNQGNPWLFSGFQQLDTRYATGGKNQSKGTLLIYSFKPRLDETLASWRSYLSEKRSDLNYSVCTKSTNSFRTTHVHRRTGADLEVRHTAVSLLWSPA